MNRVETGLMVDIVATILEAIAYGISVSGSKSELLTLSYELRLLHLPLWLDITRLSIEFNIRFGSKARIYIRALMEPGRFFGSLGQWFSILSKVTYIAQQLLGNGVIMYRTWVLWDRRWKIIAIPCCFLLLMTESVGVGCALIPKISSRVGNALMRTFSLMIVILNIVCTSLIAYPLWSLHRKRSRLQKNATKRWSSLFISMIRILIESAVLQLLIEGLFLILNSVNHLAQYIFYCLAVPFIPNNRQGITFTLITLRIKVFSSIVCSQDFRGGPMTFTTINLGGLTEHSGNGMLTISEAGGQEAIVADPSGGGEPSDLLRYEKFPRLTQNQMGSTIPTAPSS
ncbi:hypothetical protein L218DRAFT_944313 [Marasmius fiardii PR-910]|nr:hypothetical protein L218DRAFT_944313 [Marasmius fiardii PR-910]